MHIIKMQTLDSIIDILSQDHLSGLADLGVYFDDLYWIDEHNLRIDVIKLKDTGKHNDWLIETECGGASVSEHLNRCGLMTLTLVYLRLQKMDREFKSTKKKSCCKSSPECYNCPEKKSP